MIAVTLLLPFFRFFPKKHGTKTHKSSCQYLSQLRALLNFSQLKNLAALSVLLMLFPKHVDPKAAKHGFTMQQSSAHSSMLYFRVSELSSQPMTQPTAALGVKPPGTSVCDRFGRLRMVNDLTVPSHSGSSVQRVPQCVMTSAEDEGTAHPKL